MAWSSDSSPFCGNVQPGTVALIATLVIGAVLFCHQLARHLFPSRPRPEPKQVKKDIVVRIQDIPIQKSLIELKKELASLAVQDQQLEPTVNGLDQVTLARINKDDACATAIFPTVLSQSELPRRLAQASKEAGLPYSFDCEFSGITPLTDADGDDAVDIVAVPGLASHPIGSWKSSHRGNNKVWLRDFLPRDIPNARILLFGYDTKLSGSDSRQTIEDLSIRLLDLLSSFRAEDKLKRRPIIFIGHSLGGLLVKECLLQAMKRQSFDHHHAVYQACCGLLLFGVPNHGLNNSQLLNIVNNQANESLIRDLVLDKNLEPSTLLKRISGEFSERCGGHSPVVYFYETRLSPTVQMLPNGTLEKSGPSASMVTTHSATAFVGEAGEPAVPFNVDHSGLVKFDSRGHELYIVVLDRLKRLVSGSRDRLRKRNSDNLSPQDQSIWNSLNDPPYSAFRNSAKLPKPEKGTLEWLIHKDDKDVSYSQDRHEGVLRPEDFQHWRDSSESSSLLVTAPPGSGKSVLSNFVIRHLEAEASQGTKVIYYFCSIRTDETAPDARSVLRSLIVQLCETRAMLFRLLPTDWTEKSDNFKSATLSRLVDIFGQLLRHEQLSRVYCVIDGLDVYEEPAMVELVDGLRKIWKSNTSSNLNAHLFCTSRPHRKLLDAWGSSETCRLRCNKDDITTFIDQRVSRLGPDFDRGLKDFVQNQLLLRSEQSFLWLDVVVRRIENLELPTQTGITNEIESSSHDLDDLYRFLIQRAACRNEKLLRMLIMVIYAERPLSCDELEHAVAIDVAPITETHSYGNFVKNVAHLNAANITKALGTLLDVVEGKVMALHQSLKDFFQHSWESLPLTLSISPTVYPAYVLMKYLLLNHEHEPEEKFPLFDYASEHWHRHVASEAEIYTHTPLRDMLGHLLSFDPCSTYSTRKGSLFSRDIESSASPTRYGSIATTTALQHNIGWLINILLDNRIDRLSLGCAPLSVIERAAYQERFMVVEAFISHGTKETLPLSRDVIELICEICPLRTIQLLLDKRGSEVHTTSTLVSLALGTNYVRFWWEERDTLIKLLLKSCPSNFQITSKTLVDVAGCCNETTLETVFRTVKCGPEITTGMLEEITAAARPHGKAVAFLLDRTGGNVRITETMLRNAARSFNGRELIEVLLDEKYEAIQITEKVLEEAALNEYGAVGIFELLFEKRCNEIHITNAVLNAATTNSIQGPKLIELLFRECDADINIRNEALAQAARNRQGEGILVAFFQHRGHEILNTEVVIAAASNNYSTAALRFVCEKMGDEMDITPEVVTAAASSTLRMEMLEFLFERGSEAIPIPPQAIRTAAENSEGALDFLLSKVWGNFAVTEGDLLAAITWARRCPSSFELLLEHGGGNVPITPRVVFAAAESSECWMIDRLLEIDRGIISMVQNEFSLIVSASRHGNFRLVERLLEIGADPDFTAPNQPTALELAIQGNDYEIVELLAQNGANLNITCDKRGWSPLAFAMTDGRHEVMELLLHLGADVASKTADGWSSLALAAVLGDCKAAELLLRAGADPFTETDDGRCCLAMACQHGHSEVATLLLNTFQLKTTDQPDVPGGSAQNMAIERGNKYLHSPPKLSDFAIGKKNPQGRTPIWYTAAGGQVSLLKSLLKLHPEGIDERDGFGITPLSAAARSGRPGVVRALLASGHVQSESRDCIGKTPLWWAEKFDRPVMMRLLSQKVENLDDEGFIQQEETMANFLSLGYCDICLVAIAEIKGARYKCELCGFGGDYTVICGNCVQEGGHCLDSSHQLTLIEE